LFPKAWAQAIGQWHFTDLYLSVLAKYTAAQGKAPTLAWAYGASLDRQEQGIMTLVEHRLLTREAPF